MKKTASKASPITFRPDPDNAENLNLAAENDANFNTSKYMNEALRLYGEKVLRAMAEEKKQQAEEMLTRLDAKRKDANKR